jgi:GNAT superfamily N-acetyltransferase
LSPGHTLAGFDCGEPILDEWLLRRALANQARGASRTYVVTEGGVVVGYYCLSAGAVARQEATAPLRRNMPDPVPIMVLGRLAVRRDLAGRGIGTGMLADAIRRTLQVAEIAGVAALLVHALHQRAAEFYLSQGFHRSPVGEMTLMLALAEMKANHPR